MWRFYRNIVTFVVLWLSASYVALCCIDYLLRFFLYSCGFQSEDNAEMLRKYGGFVPGVRPGKNTADYLDLRPNAGNGPWGGISVLDLFDA
jgi:preprotein translocase subunit SecY